MATAPAPLPTRRLLPRDQRRRAILQAAAYVFAQAGYAHTSMDDIAAAGGVTKLIVYRHFDSKDGLYRAVLEETFERQTEIFMAAMEHGLQPETAPRTVLAVAREHPDAFRLLWQYAAREPNFAEYAASLRDTAVTAARVVVADRVPAELQEWAAQTIFDTVMAAVFNWLEHGDAARDEEFVARTAAGLRSLVHGLTASLPS